MHRKQLTILLVLLIIYALSAFLVYAFFIDQLTAMVGIPTGWNSILIDIR